MRRRYFLLLSFFVFSLYAIAQNNVVKGRVSSDDGRPIEGATVNVKGTKINVIANPNGEFSISVPSLSGTLVISSVGFVTAEQPISGNDLNIVLKKDDRRLSEIVVVGYGQAQRRNVSGAISRISAREVENQPVQSFETALQGKAAGVVIENSSGKVGQGIKMRIREHLLCRQAASLCMYWMVCRLLRPVNRISITNQPIRWLILILTTLNPLKC